MKKILITTLLVFFLPSTSQAQHYLNYTDNKIKNLFTELKRTLPRKLAKEVILFDADLKNKDVSLSFEITTMNKDNLIFLKDFSPEILTENKELTIQSFCEHFFYSKLIDRHYTIHAGYFDTARNSLFDVTITKEKCL
tara:strand:- start:1333 stop:1746 length:414 start_codon:yes stop_codon:yes gene_type:complete